MRDTVAIVRIEISDGEARLLREFLETSLSDLRMEISGTDALDYRERLKVRETLLNKLLRQIGGR